MKKWFVLLIAVLLVLLAVSCQSISPTPEPTAKPTTPATATPQPSRTVSVKFYDRDILVGGQDALEAGTLLTPTDDYTVTDDETYTYQFLGWDANGDGVAETFPYAVNEDTVFTAIIEKEYITYHYDIYVSGELKSSVDCHYGDEIVYPEVSSGFVDGKANIFAGWQYDGVFDGYTRLNITQKQLRIDAYFPDTQVVTFTFESGIFAEIVEAGNPIVIRDDWDLDPGEGYIIAWYLDENYSAPLTSSTMIEGNLSLFGRREPAAGVDFTVISSENDMLNSFNYVILNREAQKQYFLLYDYGTPDELVSSLAEKTLQLYSVSISAKAIDKYNITLSMTYSPIASHKTEEVIYSQIPSFNVADHQAYRPASYNSFPVEKMQNTLNVNNSEALYFALENGYRPICTDGETAALYENMKAVLRYAVSDTMTDVQKARAIYEYLVLNITYDGMLGEAIEKDQSELAGNNSFFLEGVFNDRVAVCDGLSKAYACLCNMEGIPCVRVTGKKLSNDVNHAWNKVMLDGYWYGVDVTAGGTIIGNSEVLTYHFFMMSDTVLNAFNAADADSYTDLLCVRTYDVYADLGLRTTSVADSADKLNAFLEQVESGKCSCELELAYDYADASAAVSDILREINKTLNIEYVNEGNHFCFIYTK